jgi:hypothetical protein
MKADVVDINAATSKDGRLNPDMTDDGIHFNSRGCEAWLVAVQPYLSAEGRGTSPGRSGGRSLCGFGVAVKIKDIGLLVRQRSPRLE